MNFVYYPQQLEFAVDKCNRVCVLYVCGVNSFCNIIYVITCLHLINCQHSHTFVCFHVSLINRVTTICSHVVTVELVRTEIFIFDMSKL